MQFAVHVSEQPFTFTRGTESIARAACLTSRIGIENPEEVPRNSGVGEKEYCILLSSAMSRGFRCGRLRGATNVGSSLFQNDGRNRCHSIKLTLDPGDERG